MILILMIDYDYRIFSPFLYIYSIALLFSPLYCQPNLFIPGRVQPNQATHALNSGIYLILFIDKS